MKKIIMIAVLSLFFSISAQAEIGTITSVQFGPTDTQIILNVGGSGIWSPINETTLTGDRLKSFIAAVLTAKTTAETVELSWQDGGWIAIKLK